LGRDAIGGGVQRKKAAAYAAGIILIFTMDMIYRRATDRLIWAVGYLSEGRDATMEVYQALTLMISFATLVVLILTNKQK
jgi:hypothetical protein